MANNNNKNEYQHLEEEEEYVPTTNIGNGPTAVTYQLPPQQPGQPLQYFYVVQPPVSAADQQTHGGQQQPQLYYPQVYYPHLMGQPQQQQQPTRLPPLPQVSQPQQHAVPNQNNYAYPTTTPTHSGSGQIPITQESYVNVQGVEPILVLLCSFLMPGLGHLIIGMQSKGAVYFIVNFIMGIIIAATSWIFVGLAFIPFVFVYFILIMIDSYVLADRLKKGYPVLKGECYFRVTSWGVSLLEKKSPVFVHGVDEPLEWQQKCEQVRRQLNL
ncbi:hypothetical protein C9374_006348 [Naegleria lovaniensis]|uniref:Uncharacterized protein n=1 Tax=Naegleria lovaniensis TaxID=51637 RepID=A0AA88GI15_NAELO|nr:uncharacterized protein C9374_006348 [Naegleria lovaniensis]KAG2381359.1 hypothetical protein C9374_006348 [Naegleria lovaniensis]